MFSITVQPLNQDGRDGLICMAYGKEDICLLNFNENTQTKDIREVNWRSMCRSENNIALHIKDEAMTMWIGFIWLRIGTGGTLLSTG
jgi:hypothetical protein